MDLVIDKFKFAIIAIFRLLILIVVFQNLSIHSAYGKYRDMQVTAFYGENFVTGETVSHELYLDKAARTVISIFWDAGDIDINLIDPDRVILRPVG